MELIRYSHRCKKLGDETLLNRRSQPTRLHPLLHLSVSCVVSITKLNSLNYLQNGDLCISILHPPVDDPQSGELPCERWNPTQSVRTVLLSVISLLNEPNTYSPANVDASVMYRRWRESKGKDKEYENIIR